MTHMCRWRHCNDCRFGDRDIVVIESQVGKPVGMSHGILSYFVSKFEKGFGRVKGELPGRLADGRPTE